MPDDLSELADLRRDLHAHAEPGWCEVRTAAKVVGHLRALGYDVHFGRNVIAEASRVGLPDADLMESFYQHAITEGAPREVCDALRGGFTGVVGLLKGKRPGPVVAVRMDMDANLGTEADDLGHVPAKLGFGSVNNGVHHNCGHDGHTSIGIGLARLLAAARSDLAGEVRLIFQPAEEGLRGAQAMVDAGVLDGVDIFLGFHIGVQALKNGELIAGYDNILASLKFDVNFTGADAHAAISPHVGRNALLSAAVAIQGLLALPRHGDGETRVNVGRLTAGGSRNTIPARAFLEAEIRADSTTILDSLWEHAQNVVSGAALTQKVTAEVTVQGRSVAGNSDPALARFIVDIAERDGTATRIRPSADFKGSDDAAIMMNAVQKQGGQAVYMGFGSPLAAVHHNPRFDFDEAVLPFGAKLLANLVLAATADKHF